MAIHIGKIIRRAFEEKKPKLTVIDFAKKMGYTRDTIYKIFASESIDTETLEKICHVLNEDFFTYYSADLQRQLKKVEKKEFATKADIEKILKEIRSIKRK